MTTADLRHDLAAHLTLGLPASWKVTAYLDVVDEIDEDALLMVGSLGGSFDPTACRRRWRLQAVLCSALTEPGPADDALDDALDTLEDQLATTRWMVADSVRTVLAPDDSRPCYVLTLEDLT